MPGPLVVAVLTAIPWPLILKQGPALLQAADALLATSRRAVGGVSAANDAEALRQRVAALEDQQQAFATLVKELTDHLNAVTIAAQASALRVRQSLIVGGVGVVLGLAGCLLAFLR